MHRHKANSDAINALKTARGQIDGILKMLDDDRYCIDISKQIFAVQSLLKKANMKILRNHLHSCVLSAMKEGQGDEKIDEIIYILEKYIDKT
ncbi:MAG: CsoR family transcriptional regulator, copper-sensing transcriptional repressor [Clostridia bacterium]|jgi:DNA-binding FrmR family transcriptional regulator|nr:CsoR family transcriptional regulator, copper-sensing transcriptional repressor [Clostridia bacterium]MDN5322363.1 CsoR family transcriptional regulator, copper-sensing transcriptional repressor [Clostridia bacterium]